MPTTATTTLYIETKKNKADHASELVFTNRRSRVPIPGGPSTQSLRLPSRLTGTCVVPRKKGSSRIYWLAPASPVAVATGRRALLEFGGGTPPLRKTPKADALTSTSGASRRGARFRTPFQTTDRRQPGCLDRGTRHNQSKALPAPASCRPGCQSSPEDQDRNLGSPVVAAPRSRGRGTRAR